MRFIPTARSKSILLPLLLVLWHTTSNAQTQGKDSEGKSVFDYYTPAEARLQVGVDEPVQVSGGWDVWLQQWTRSTKDGTNQRTVDKNIGFVGSVALVNSSDQLDLNNLLDSRFGLSFTLGGQISIDTLYKGFETVSGAWAFGGVTAFGFDNILLFDAADSTCGEVRPWSYGLKGSAIRILSPSAERDKLVSIAFSADIGWTWNKHELTSFVSRSNATVRRDAVAFEEADGSYGTLREDLFRHRWTVSLPVYWKRMFIMPYTSVTTIGSDPTVLRWGGQIGVTDKGSPLGKYKLPSALVLGIDWAYDDRTNFSTGALYLTGSFTLFD